MVIKHKGGYFLVHVQQEVWLHDGRSEDQPLQNCPGDQILLLTDNDGCWSGGEEVQDGDGKQQLFPSHGHQVSSCLIIQISMVKSYFFSFPVLMWPSSQCAPLPSMSCSVTKNEANVFLSIGLVNNIGKTWCTNEIFLYWSNNIIKLKCVESTLWTLQQIWQV